MPMQCNKMTATESGDLSIVTDEFDYVSFPRQMANSEIVDGVEIYHPRKYPVYTRRWYIILLFGYLSFVQAYIWGMFGPIYLSMKQAFNWSDAQLALLPFYGTVTFLTLCMPSAWLLEKFGLRRIVIIMAGLTASGCAMRCIPGTTTGINVWINIAGVINGMAGVVTMYVPACISAHWFPPNERRTATALGTLLNPLGLALSFVGGPLFVSSPSSGASSEQMKEDYFVYTYVQTGFAIAGLLLVLFYYPDEPPSPPSESSELERVQMKAGCKQLLPSWDFWVVTTPFILNFGTYGGWVSVLDVDLENKDIDESVAGWIGFTSTLVGSLLGIVAGKLGDKFGHLKAIQLAACVLTLQGAMWLVLIVHGYVTFSIAQAYIAVILVGIGNNAMLPISFELAAENLYPVDEAVVVGLMGALCNVISTAFLVVLFFPATGVAWLNWFYVIAAAGAIPFASLVKERNKRSHVDEGALD